jgi:uncharacterized protein (TIGR03083 family)
MPHFFPDRPYADDVPQITPAGIVDVRPLFAPMHQELLMVLRTLSPEDWLRPTAAPGWSVRDVVAHLVDTAMRRLSAGRDGHLPPLPAGGFNSTAELVAFINQLNAEWIAASRRVSPRLLIDVLDGVGRQLIDFLESQDLQAPARFGVAWAGEHESAAWFDIGREYTERWHHHQQIVEAVEGPLLVSRRFLYPVLDLSMRALPFAYRGVEAEPATVITVEVTGEAGGAWTLVREPLGWRLFNGALPHAAAHLRVDQDTTWRMFFKQRSREQVLATMSVSGRAELAQPFAGVLAVMA